MSAWIACSERSPKPGQHVLVQLLEGRNCVAHTEDGSWVSEDFWLDYVEDKPPHPRLVTHWMPLPEPPK